MGAQFDQLKRIDRGTLTELSVGEGRGRSVRLRLKIGAAVVLLLVGVGVAILVSVLTPSGGTSTVVPGDGATSSDGDGELPAGGGETPDDGTQGSASVFVHILGAVAQPGLYELREGDRAIDAVAAAGGLTEKADEAQLNLARFITDGEQIIVPEIGEPPPAAGASAGSGGAGGAPAAKININTADAAALETLPGVGPALAGRIIDWRETNGAFSSVDDLLNVTGIGQKTLDGFREGITT